MSIGLGTALGVGSRLAKHGVNAFGLNRGRKSDAERHVDSMVKMLGQDISKPLTETTGFKTGQGVLNKRDRRNRQAISNNAAVSGATDESKIANLSSSNDSYNEGLQNLLSFADRLRQQNRSRYLNLLGVGENMRQNRLAKSNQAWNNVLNPLASAGQSLMMSKLLFDDSKKS